MSKFRTNTYDSMPEPKKTKPVKPGTVPGNKVPIFNHKGNMVGRCGLGMSSAGVARFTGTLDNRVVKRNGRNAWSVPRQKDQTKQRERRAPSWRSRSRRTRDRTDDHGGGARALA